VNNRLTRFLLLVLILVLVVILCSSCKNSNKNVVGNNQTGEEDYELIKAQILNEIKSKSNIQNIVMSDIRKIQGTYYVVVEENSEDMLNRYFKLWKYNKDKESELLLEGKKIKLLTKDNYYYVNYYKDFDGKFKNEIIKYDNNNEEYEKKIYVGESLEFNISPNNEYMCVENNNEIIILNNNDEIVFEQVLYNNSGNVEENSGVEIKINDWTKDSKQLWVATGLHAWLTTFHIIDVEKLTIKTIHSDKAYGISEIDLNTDNGCIVYSTHPEFLDVDSYNEFLNSKTIVYLYLKNLLTNEEIQISTSITKKFNPKWIGDKTIEYNDTVSEGRIIYNMDNY